MGCLIEFLGEFFIELIFTGYWFLMTLIIPEKMTDKKFKKRMTTVVGLFTVALTIAFVVGLGLLIGEDPAIETAGIYLSSISGGLILLQILAGVLVRTLSGRKNQTKN